MRVETADCGKTETDYPREDTIAQLFEQQATRTPDAVAVISAGRTLTYRELDHRSNRLAQHLRTLGVQAETLVGVAVERSAQMIVGLLAILKAGGAYVPIDPSYPQERIECEVGVAMAFLLHLCV